MTLVEKARIAARYAKEGGNPKTSELLNDLATALEMANRGETRLLTNEDWHSIAYYAGRIGACDEGDGCKYCREDRQAIQNLLGSPVREIIQELPSRAVLKTALIEAADELECLRRGHGVEVGARCVSVLNRIRPIVDEITKLEGPTP